MSRKYTPRRQSKRWLDGDCPNGVLAIYDSPRFADRYTIFYGEPVADEETSDPWLGSRGASAYPFRPQGIASWLEMRAHEVASYRYEHRNRAAKWSSLPPDVQQLVRQDIDQ